MQKHCASWRPHDQHGCVVPRTNLCLHTAVSQQLLQPPSHVVRHTSLRVFEYEPHTMLTTQTAPMPAGKPCKPPRRTCSPPSMQGGHNMQGAHHQHMPRPQSKRTAAHAAQAHKAHLLLLRHADGLQGSSGGDGRPQAKVRPVGQQRLQPRTPTIRIKL